MRGDDATDLIDLSEALLAPDSGGQLRDWGGQQFGRYRLQRLLGRGGMGQVYLAEQSAPVQRNVAIKLAQGTRLDLSARALFEVERQALARMSHPGIAQLFDAGTTNDGTPFFAMEFVDGETLDAFVRKHGVSLDMRLVLFEGVCRAVEHAHRRGVLHCDLKPSNVLVSELDQGWQPRLIDFGVARSLSRAGHAQSVGTPAYMSPEQATASAILDTRSDVFALGVILYELATGQRYRDFEACRDLPAEKIRSRIREGQPPSWPAQPSSDDGVSGFRWHELSCIVARATQTDPECRYGSAAELADEVLRWRKRQAVLAVGDSGFYRMRCVVRRHRLAVFLGALVLVSLAAGLLLTQRALDLAQQQRDLATGRQVELEKTVAFQRDLLTRMDLPRFSARLVALMAEKQDRRDMEHGLPTTGDQLAEQLLALAPVDAVRDLLGEQWLDPAVDLLDASGSANAAQMLLLLGQINRRMSRLQEASSLVERARQEFQRTGDLNAELAARFEAARIVQDLGQSTTAFKSMQEVVTAIRENLPESAPLRLQAEEVWGTALVNQGRYADALEAFAVPLRIGIEQERDDVAFRGLQSLQQRTLLYAAGQCDDDLLERMRTTRDAWSALADTASRAGSHYNLGSCHFWRGEYRAALPEFTQAVEQYRLHFGDYHPKLASFRSMQHLAALGAGELDGLEAPFTLAVRDAERASGVNSVTAMIARQALSELWSRQGRHAKALESYRQLLRDATESGEVNPSLVITWRSFLAHAEARAGGINAALQSFDQAIADCAVTQQSDAADCLQLQLDRMSFAVDPPDQLVLMAEELCEKIDAVTDERALLRSRCTAVWLDVLDRSGNSARRDELRRQRLGWLDRERIHAYGDEDQAQLLPWVL